MRALRIPLFLSMISLLCAAPAHGAAARAAPARKPPARAIEAPPPVSPAISEALRKQAGGAYKRFYAERGFRPLWLVPGGVSPAAKPLLEDLASADLDGLRPSSYGVDRLRTIIAETRSGDPAALARAELALSTAFARFVQDQRRTTKRDGTIYADSRLKPKKLKPDAVLRAASFPRSFPTYVANMEWMSPHYVRLRELAARTKAKGASRAEMARLALNLDRARILPGPWMRHVVVDASSGRLWYYEAGKQVGTMRVVVGTEKTQTPMLAGMLQWAILNPYWNVPTYLARDSVAPKILAGRSLTALKMEALSDWSSSPRKLSQSEVDWKAVAAGQTEVRLRELPGAHNSMGRVKFLFPNEEGIYLHDTPARDLLKQDDRHFSNGCIRLENAAELGKWLLHKPLSTRGVPPEKAVALPVQVPVFLTYLTATTTQTGLAFRNDVYLRDE